MERIEDTAMRIMHAYEDYYFDTEKRGPFDAILRRYLAVGGPGGERDLYEAAVAMGRNHPREFAEMVESLRGAGLLG